MTFTTEDLDAIEGVDATTVDDALATDCFGKFAILSASAETFIQAGNDWQPDEACTAFIEAHSSEPWILEYRENGRQFRTTGRVTLEQVRQTFGSYLSGGSEWRTKFTWAEMEL